MEATVSAPLQGLQMKTGWVSLTQAAGLGYVRSPLWGWQLGGGSRTAPTARSEIGDPALRLYAP